MDAILARVGEVELRQHCEAAVVDELKLTDDRVRDVLAALQRVLKVTQASRELHKTLVLNNSEQVQLSFRQLGESCNQIGPLLRLLHRTMGTTPLTTLEPVALVATTLQSSSDSTTVSEYELSSDSEQDEPEIVEVSPPKNSKKRKASTVDLSESLTPTTKVKITGQDIRQELAKYLDEIQAISVEKYSVTIHETFVSFVKKVFATNNFDNWQPRDDPILSQLLNEMGRRVAAFKDSDAQTRRLKRMKKWQQEMTALSSVPISNPVREEETLAFVPTLNLTSLPPVLDSRLASFKVPGCKKARDLAMLVKPGQQILSAIDKDSSSLDQKKAVYFEPLLVSTTRFFAAAAKTNQSVMNNHGASQCNAQLRMLAFLPTVDTVTPKDCEQLEELVHLIRVVILKNPNFCKKAELLVQGLLNLFPHSTQLAVVLPACKTKKNSRRKNNVLKQLATIYPTSQLTSR